jgi:hypothetical protein
MLRFLLACLFKPNIKIKPELNELELLKNKIRMRNEYMTVITDSIKEKSSKCYEERINN